MVGGSDAVEGDGEDLVHHDQMRGKVLSGKSVKFEHKSKIF